MTSPMEFSDQDRIDAEAAAWYVRRLENAATRSSSLRDATEDQAFMDWLAADPRHDEAYTLIAQTGDDIALAVAASDYQSPATRQAHRRKLSFALLAATIVLGLVGGGTSFVLLEQQKTKITGTGETRLLALADGTKVNLSGQSEIEVRFNRKQRQIILKHGEAFFDVGRDPQRPFSVVVGDSVIRDIGTQFNVNMRRSSVEISVVQGEVSVTPGASAPTAIKASQRARLNLLPTTQAQPSVASPLPNGSLSASPAVIVAALPYQSAVALKEGRQFYDNVALGDIVEDMNRFYAPGIAIASPDLAERRLTASLAPRDIDAFLAGLPITAQVRVNRDRDGHVTILSQSEGADRPNGQR